MTQANGLHRLLYDKDKRISELTQQLRKEKHGRHMANAFIDVLLTLANIPIQAIADIIEGKRAKQSKHSKYGIQASDDSESGYGSISVPALSTLSPPSSLSSSAHASMTSQQASLSSTPSLSNNTTSVADVLFSPESVTPMNKDLIETLVNTIQQLKASLHKERNLGVRDVDSLAAKDKVIADLLIRLREVTKENKSLANELESANREISRLQEEEEKILKYKEEAMLLQDLQKKNEVISERLQTVRGEKMAQNKLVQELQNHVDELKKLMQESEGTWTHKYAELQADYHRERQRYDNLLHRHYNAPPTMAYNSLPSEYYSYSQPYSTCSSQGYKPHHYYTPSEVCVDGEEETSDVSHDDDVTATSSMEPENEATLSPTRTFDQLMDSG